MTDLLDLLSVFGTCNEVPCGPAATLLEYQGYDYETVQIGEQCWFAENLNLEFVSPSNLGCHPDGMPMWIGWLRGDLGCDLPER